MNGLRTDLTLSFVRQILGLVAGSLVTAGYMSAGNAEVLCGVVVGIATLTLSAVHHALANKTPATQAVPTPTGSSWSPVGTAGA